MADLQITRLSGAAVADYNDINAAFGQIEEHGHGSISKDGKVGGTPGLVLVTGEGGAVQSMSLDAFEALLKKATRKGVGELYISLDPTSPVELFGGTWSKWAEGRFPVSAGTNYPAASVGGAASVALTADQGGMHDHDIMIDSTSGAASSSSGIGYLRGMSSQIGRIGVANAGAPIAISGAVQPKGTGAPHENRPPYRAVHIWEKVA